MGNAMDDDGGVLDGFDEMNNGCHDLLSSMRIWTIENHKGTTEQPEHTITNL
jgi:hypothetical protein